MSTSLFINLLIFPAVMLASVNLSHAGARDEARKVLYVLRQTGVAQKSADEMQSIDNTFSTAEQYFQQNDTEASDRYYLLTIQKARVLLINRLDRTPDSSKPAPTRQQPNAPQKLPPSSQNLAKAPLPLAEDSSATHATVQPKSSEQQAGEGKAPSPPEQLQANTSSEPEYFSDDVTSEKLVGSSSIYTVLKKESLRLVAAKLGVSRQHLAKINNLDPNAPLKVGQKLKYNNRKIVPQRMTNGIVINIPDRTLYYFKQGKLAVSIPVALGAPKKNDKHDWKTPTGKFKITAKQKDPTWHVPTSIQSEMEDKGNEIIAKMPPGPNNPLGKYAIRTSLPGIMIHSTTKPGSIYSFASHGCIRVSPEHMEEFFKEIKVNTPGEIIYRPVKLAVTEEGRIFMEVHQDAYSKKTNLDTAAKQLIEKQRLSERVDWSKVESVIRHKTGIAEDISL
jgi:lipoprotein-anchoring transpeptidase ErfK/SrfK